MEVLYHWKCTFKHQKSQTNSKKKFAIAAFNPEYEAFVIYIAALNISFDIDDEVHSSKKAQIAYLKTDEAFTNIFSSKYNDFADIFLPKLATTLLKYMGINNHVIKLIND